MRFGISSHALFYGKQALQLGENLVEFGVAAQRRQAGGRDNLAVRNTPQIAYDCVLLCLARPFRLALSGPENNRAGAPAVACTSTSSTRRISGSA